MHIDLKYTVWDRVEIPKDLEEEVEQALKEDKINSPQDLFDIIEDIEIETLYGTAEFIQPYEQEGFPTIEAYKGKDKFYDNGKNNDS